MTWENRKISGCLLGLTTALWPGFNHYEAGQDSFLL